MMQQQQQEITTESKSSGGMSMSYLKVIPVVLVGVLCLVGFVLQLGGIGDRHAACNDIAGFSRSGCRDLFRFNWWSAFFQIIIVCILGLMTLAKKLPETRHAMLVFLTISTVQLILSANVFLGTNPANGDRIAGGMIAAGRTAGERTAAAGFVLSAIANFLLILGVGVPEIPLTSIPQTVFIRSQNLVGQTRGVSTGSIPMSSIPAAGTAFHEPAIISVATDVETKQIQTQEE